MISAHHHPVTVLCFSEDGKYLATYSYGDSTISCWLVSCQENCPCMLYYARTVVTLCAVNIPYNRFFSQEVYFANRTSGAFCKFYFHDMLVLCGHTHRNHTHDDTYIRVHMFVTCSDCGLFPEQAIFTKTQKPRNSRNLLSLNKPVIQYNV